MDARWGIVVAVVLGACGGARIDGTLRVPTSSEGEALEEALRAAHGPEVRVLEARALRTCSRSTRRPVRRCPRTRRAACAEGP